MTYLELPLYPGQPAAANVGIETGTDRPQRLIAEVGCPNLAVVRPDEPCGTTVVILPGGGYRRVCLDKEGLDFARLMAGWGVTTGVVTYRQPEGRFVDPPLPLQDARRALELVEEHAAAWGLNPEKTVLMGFSAGGHLALTTLREPGNRVQSPRFLVLGYSVAGLRSPLVHEGSRDNLLGSDAAPSLVERFSAERTWEAQEGRAPEAALLVHADNDGAVPVGNSLAVAESLRRAGTAVELLRHPTGGHGFGLGPASGYADAPDWTPRLSQWLVERGLAR